MDYWEKANHSWSSDSTRFIDTPTQKNRKLFYYVQEIGQFKAAKPYFTERENLSSFLVKFTLSGEGQLIYKNQTYSLKAGDLFFIDCNNYQHYKTVSSEPWEMDWVHFSGGNTSIFYNEFIKNGHPVFHTSAPDIRLNRIHLLIEKLLKLQQEPNAKTAFQNSLLLHELLNELILQKYQLDFSDQDIPNYIFHVKKYLDENYVNSISLEELENMFHINKFQLSKDFSRYIGQPPIDYQISQKITYAKDLLRYSKLTIQAISLEVGLDNFAYFSRLFRKKTGVSPKEYRKMDYLFLNRNERS
ncbi:AraC family transcriptional regulator [Enterococcus sp. AZ192]|uniref:AraC family transcriptional regulator n=1 Tax=unclassified Enterococcus TaxID=2608891 RepID=UPI003D2718D5